MRIKCRFFGLKLFLNPNVIIFRCNPKYPKVLYFGTGATIKYGLSYPVFTETIKNSGSSRHNKFLQDAKEGKVQ